ncbi:TIGR03435 family protein [Terriglobus roseus]|uniref:Soil-associated protein, TIGR03435 family n=1 Tax=Terriglobus roseus TaxID=392734 RepID=A0A1G7FMB6_9BACT|nr:TIGR03435 family protein [Terriglobus roseus]SDE77004.1 soil-associated protein, TIGR03435 family [Terriglobus roseus]
MRFGVSARIALAAVMFTAIPCTVVSARAASAQAAEAKSNIEGTWQGAVRQPDGRDNRWVVKIEKAPTGWKGTLWFIDQKSPAIPIDKVAFTDGTLSLDIRLTGLTYEGKISPDGNTIAGTRTAGDNKASLIFVRATNETAWAIPEPPKPVPLMDPKADPSWEVATIKPAPPDEKGKGFGGRPRHFQTFNTTLNDLIFFAYGLNPKQLEGGDAWRESEKFDITTGEPNEPGAPDPLQMESMMKKLIAERFGLKFHMVKKEMSAYVISVAKGGPKLTPSTADPRTGSGFGFPGKLGNLVFRNITMDGFASWMQGGVFDRPCVNHTGIEGHFDGSLKWSPDETQFQIFGVKIVPDESADAPPPITTAMEQQLGLKLTTERTAVDVMVIDHVERPSDN